MRRADDPQGDFREQRQPQEMIDFGFGRWRLKASGALTLILLGILAIVGAQLYVGWEIRSASSAEHGVVLKSQGLLFTAQDRLSCIVTLSAEERQALRHEFRPGAFARWCPWVRENER